MPREIKNNPADLSGLVDVFALYPEIDVVYLFGSAVAGRTNRESDLDFAVYPGTDSLKSAKLDLLGRLAGKGFSKVDLVFLDGRDIVMDYEAVRSNRRVYQKPGFDSGSLYSAVVRKYLDFVPILEVQRRVLKRRILDGAA
jgi:predicted nucleotidyltransferase